MRQFLVSTQQSNNDGLKWSGGVNQRSAVSKSFKVREEWLTHASPVELSKHIRLSIFHLQTNISFRRSLVRERANKLKTVRSQKKMLNSDERRKRKESRKMKN